MLVALTGISLASAVGCQGVVNAINSLPTPVPSPSPTPNPATLVTVVNKQWVLDGGYDYIRGSVQNGSDQTVRYWKLTAFYKNSSGDIVDSAFTNDLEDLLPGASKKFEIMHKASPEITSVSVVFSKVEFK